MTKPLPKKPIIEKPKKQTCLRCHVEKNLSQRYFLYVSGTTRYQRVCKVCKGAEKRAKEQLKEKERRMMRLRQQEERAIARAKASETVSNRRYAQKKKRARNSAEKELANRELARRRLIHFTLKFNDKYKAGWVHKLLCAKLEKFSRDVANERSPRLMVFMPPRTGKSELASKNFPAWHLGHNPDHEVIASSYAVSLPEGFSRKIKNMLGDKAYQALFPETKLDPNAQATSGWLTTRGGGYVPAGVGGGITGKGAHVLIIDDPVKDAQEADSESQREAVWDWWDSTADTRLAPGGGVLVIQTRWHDDDLSGRMLRQMQEALDEIKEETQVLEQQRKHNQVSKEQYGAEKKRLKEYAEEITRWEVITFPAMAEEDEWLDTRGLKMRTGHDVAKEIPDNVYHEFVERRQQQISESKRERTSDTYGPFKLLRVKGEALHPARYDELAFRKKKRASQKRFWSALYQQNPVPDEGVYFRKDMFRFEPTLPDYRRMNIYIAWDLAIGQRQVNDWTVGLVGAHDSDDRVHIINMVRVKTDKLAELVMDTAGGYKGVLQLVGLERGQLQMAIMPNLEKEIAKRRHYISIDKTLNPVTDKLARARPAQGYMEQGRVILPANQPWIDTFQAELLRFPGGLHDDIVDALAWLIRMVLKQQPPKKGRVKKPKGWRDKLKVSNRGKGGAMAA